MAELAQLSISVDSTAVQGASADLDGLAASAGTAETATGKITQTAYEAAQAQKAQSAETSVTIERLDHASQAADNFQAALRRQALTLNMTASELAAYNAAQLGVADSAFTQKYIAMLKEAESQTGGFADRIEGRFQTMALRSGLHFLVITAAIMGTVNAIKDYLTIGDQLFDMETKLVEAGAKHAQSVSGIIHQMEQEREAWAKGYATVDGATNALTRQQSLRDQLMAQGPEYRKALADENMSWEDILKTVKALNQEKLNAVNAQIKGLESQKEERTEPGLGDAIWASIKTLPTSIATGDLTGTQAAMDLTLKKQQDELKYNEDLNTLYAQKASLEASFAEKDASDTGKRIDGLKQESTYLRDMEELAQQRLSYTDKQTLAEKEQLALAQLSQKTDADLRKFTTQAQQKQITPGQADSLSWEAIDQEQQSKLQITAQFNDQVEALQQKLNNDVGAMEEQGYEQRRAKMVDAFAKDLKIVQDYNASVDKLTAEGKFAAMGVSAPNKLVAPSQDVFDARLAAFDAQNQDSAANKMIEGLKKIEQEKGVALDFTEQIAALTVVQQKLGIDVPGAIDVATAKLQALQARTSDGWRGAEAALKDYEIHTQDTFTAAKNATDSAMKSLEDNIIQFTNTGKANWKSMVDSWIVDLERLMLEKNTLGPLAGWLSKIPWGSPSGSGASNYTGGEDGGFTGQTDWGDSLSSGPIPSSGQSVQQSNQITITVHTHENGQATTSTADGSGTSGKDVAQKLRGLVVQTLIEEQRPGGALNRKA